MSLQLLPAELAKLDVIKADYDAARARVAELTDEYNAQAKVVAQLVDSMGLINQAVAAGAVVDKLAIARQLVALTQPAPAPAVVPGGSDGGDL